MAPDPFYFTCLRDALVDLLHDVMLVTRMPYPGTRHRVRIDDLPVRVLTFNLHPASAPLERPVRARHLAGAVMWYCSNWLIRNTSMSRYLTSVSFFSAMSSRHAESSRRGRAGCRRPRVAGHRCCSSALDPWLVLQALPSSGTVYFTNPRCTSVLRQQRGQGMAPSKPSHMSRFIIRSLLFL